MVYEETVRTLKETQLESEKAQKKLEVFIGITMTLSTSNSLQVHGQWPFIIFISFKYVTFIQKGKEFTLFRVVLKG